MLIPRRKIASVGDIEEVLLAETHSKEEVFQFKSYVRTAAMKHLDLNISYTQQDVKKRKKFKQEMMKRDDKICQYVMQWPVDAYVHIWTRFRRWRGLRQTTIKKGRAPKRKDTTSKHRNSTRKAGIIYFVGKLPPGCRPIPDPNSTILKVEKHGGYGTYDEKGRRSENITKTCNNDCCSETAHSLLSKSLSNYPVACPFCGYLPPIPHTIQVKLNEIFSDIPHVIPRLATNGLIHDRHLEMLSQWKECYRQEFCDHLPRHLLSPLDIALIIDMLVKRPYKDNQSVVPASKVFSPCNRASSENILPWPDEATKERLLKTRSLRSSIQEAMQLTDNHDLFKKIIVLADHHGKQFLENYKPYSQASSMQLKKAVDVITQKEASLLRYEDQWPIRFYLQRKANDLRLRNKQVNSTPNYDKGNFQQPLFSAISTQQRLFNCPVHLSPDMNQVAPGIINFLTDRGMEELLIPVMSIGIKTDKQFARFRTLTEQQREDIIKKASPKLDTNLFQLTMLKAAFRSDADTRQLTPENRKDGS